VITTSESKTAASVAWYVIQTKPRQEFRAEENLRNQGFCCVLPTIFAEKIHRGRRVIATEPLFARYLFVQLGCDTRNWGAIRNTRGVSRLVAFGGIPAKLPPGWIDNSQPQTTAPKRLFEAGQHVVVMQGAFSGLEGIYEMSDGEARAIVLLELLSKPCKGSFPIEALKRVA
jgi:transcriptional antiterminator RfaH